MITPFPVFLGKKKVQQLVVLLFKFAIDVTIVLSLNLLKYLRCFVIRIRWNLYNIGFLNAFVQNPAWSLLILKMWLIRRQITSSF
jgi:hypothetical protein